MESPHKEYQEVTAATPCRNVFNIGPRKEAALKIMQSDTPGRMADMMNDDELDVRCKAAVQRMRNEDREGGVERSDADYKRFVTNLKQDIKRVRDYSEDVDDVPGHLMCPISHDLLEDPVVLCTGHVFSKKYIDKWVNDWKNVDPVTGKDLESSTYYPCHVLRGLVDDYKGSRRIRIPKHTPSTSVGLHTPNNAYVGVEPPSTADLGSDAETEKCEQGMQRISVVERAASLNDDGTTKSSMADEVQDSQISCNTATAVPVRYHINQVSCAMFIHPKPYLSIGSVRDTLTDDMFEVHEVEGPSCAISTPFVIRAAPDGCFSFPILLRIRLNEQPRSDEMLSVVKLSHDNNIDDGELLAYHMVESFPTEEQFIQIELHHFCKIFAIRKVINSEVDRDFADANNRQVVSIYNTTGRIVDFEATNPERTAQVVNTNRQAVEGGVTVPVIRASGEVEVSNSGSQMYNLPATTFEESILPWNYLLVYMDPVPVNVGGTEYPPYKLFTTASNGRVVRISSGLLNSDIHSITNYTDDQLQQISRQRGI